jgi:hypothetical protein
MKQIRSSFKKAAQEFFPRWNHQGWKIRTEKRLPLGHGWCDRENKIIYANFPDEKDSLDALFVHEITHAVTTDSHRPRFFKRIRQAVEHSKRISRTNLTELLLKSISIHQNTPELKPSDIYERIKEIVIDKPDVSWQEVKGYLLDHFSMDLIYFDRYFKDARKIFDERKTMYVWTKRNPQKGGKEI